MKKLTLLSVAVAVALTGCNDDGKDGKNGADGSKGVNSLINQTNLAVGHAECRNGGVQIDSGLDSNGNNSLDSNEVNATKFVCSPTLTTVNADNNTNNAWYVSGAKTVANAAASSEQIDALRGSAKNVILFVGDGMGISTVTAARILEGQRQGKSGEEHQLSFEKLPYSGFSKTYNTDAQTPDSAGTMTAMISGVKTDMGVVGISEAVKRGDCASGKGNELVTALELAEMAGLSTGVVSTARITHATPAATYAKSADRNWEDVSDMPAEAVAAGCKDIASQLIVFESSLEARYNGLDVDGIEVVMGGGRRHFLPKDASANTNDKVSDIEGDRTDGRNLVNEWKTAYPNGQYVMDRTGFDNVDAASTKRLFGLFNESHMQYEADRGNDVAGRTELKRDDGQGHRHPRQ